MPVRSPQIFFFFSCQTRISRYRNEPAWSSEIARIGRKLGVGTDPSKCSLFKGYRTEASSLRFQKVHLARQRAEGESRSPARSARSRAESRAPGAASAGCWSILPPIPTPSGPGFSEQSCLFTGGDQEPSETIALQAACGEYPRAVLRPEIAAGLEHLRTGGYRSILVGIRGSSRAPQRGESPGKGGGREGPGQDCGTPSFSELQAGTRTVQGVARHRAPERASPPRPAWRPGALEALVYYVK